MGLVQSFCYRTLSALQSVGELPPPEFCADEIFQLVCTADAETFSRTLDQSGFDLTAVDQTSGDTLLHRAIRLQRDDITQVLLRRADVHPGMLNAPDRHGDTPLMLAARKLDIAQVKALVEMGAQMNDGFRFAELRLVHGGRCLDTMHTWLARIFTEAKGDVSQAFKIAVQYRKSGIADQCLGAGASIIPALQSEASTINWMFEHNYIRADDAMAALEIAQQTGNEALLALFRQPNNVLRVLDTLINRTDAAIVAALRRFIDVGVDMESLLSAAAGRCVAATQKPLSFLGGVAGSMWGSVGRGPDDVGVLRLLVSVGAPVACELRKRYGDPDSLAVNQMLIRFSEAFFGVEGALSAKEPITKEIARFALEDMLQNREFSEQEKVSRLKAVIQDGRTDVADDLAFTLARKGGSAGNVRLLLQTGVRPTDRLLITCAERAHKEEQHMRHFSAGPVQALERNLVRQMVRMGADVRSVMVKLFQVRRPARETELARNAARLIMYYALPDMLRKTNLSNIEKVEELRNMMDYGAKAGAVELAGDLFLDAVNAGHPNIPKIMAAAEVPVTQAFLSLSRKLIGKVPGAKSDTEKLVQQGYDFRPAMAQLLKNAKAYAESGDVQAANREQDTMNTLAVSIASALRP